MHSLPHARALSVHALLACTLLVTVSPAARAQGTARDSVDFSRLMTPAEMDSTGVARLTPTERGALAQWLARFTARAAMTARETMPLPPGHPPVAGMLPPGQPTADGALPPGHPPVQMGESAEREQHAENPSPDARPLEEDAASAPPKREPGMAPRHAAPPRAGGHAGAPRSARLEATNGALVMLRDGTRWEIYAPDRPRAAAWRPGDDIVRRAIPAPDGSYDSWLIDAQAGDSVAARFAGRRGGNPPRS